MIVVPDAALVVRLAGADAAGAVAAEVAIARYLASIGAPTERLADGFASPIDAGPVVASVWLYVGAGQPPTFSEVGQLLRELHVRTATAPAGTPRADVPGAVARHLAAAERAGAPLALLKQLRVRLEPLAGRWDAAAGSSVPAVIHGDAHPANVAGAPPRLVDLELAGVGPPGYDLAAAAVAATRYAERGAWEAAVDAYRPEEPVAVEPAWVELYELWAAAWVLARWDQPRLRVEAQRRAASLTGASGGAWERR